MRGSITALARRAQKLHQTTISVTRAGQGTGLSAGHADWDSPVSVGSAVGDVQPASAEAIQAAGLAVEADAVALFLTPPAFQITARTHRLTVDGKTYQAVRVTAWPSHWEVLAEAV